MRSGQVIRIAGEGMPVPSAPGNFGDLLVEVTVKFPPFFNGAQLEIVEQIFPEEDDEL